MTDSRQKPSRRSRRISRLLSVLLPLAAGALCGLLLGVFGFPTLEAFPGPWIPGILLLISEVVLAFLLQIILHEGGHLVAGLLTGYRFCSFNILGLQLQKERDGLHLRRLSIAGMGGQCLMAPPEPVNGRFPVFWYNLGGPLANLVSGLLALILFPVLPRHSFSALFLLLTGTIGGILAAVNGIPMSTDAADNDGRNALSLGKNPRAARAFWLQMKINQRISEGARLRDMPEEWFQVPAREDMGNSLTAALGVFACNRLMDMHRFEEADVLMERLLREADGMAGIHRALLRCDRVFAELLGPCRPDVLDQWNDRSLQSFQHSMRRFPSVLRLRYAWALLRELDEKKARAIRASFEKISSSWPFPSEIQGERELMDLALARSGAS